MTRTNNGASSLQVLTRKRNWNKRLLAGMYANLFNIATSNKTDSETLTHQEMMLLSDAQTRIKILLEYYDNNSKVISAYHKSLLLAKKRG